VLNVNRRGGAVPAGRNQAEKLEKKKGEEAILYTPFSLKIRRPGGVSGGAMVGRQKK